MRHNAWLIQCVTRPFVYLFWNLVAPIAKKLRWSTWALVILTIVASVHIGKEFFAERSLYLQQVSELNAPSITQIEVHPKGVLPTKEKQESNWSNPGTRLPLIDAGFEELIKKQLQPLGELKNLQYGMFGFGLTWGGEKPWTYALFFLGDDEYSDNRLAFDANHDQVFDLETEVYNGERKVRDNGEIYFGYHGIVATLSGSLAQEGQEAQEEKDAITVELGFWVFYNPADNQFPSFLMQNTHYWRSAEKNVGDATVRIIIKDGDNDGMFLDESDHWLIERADEHHLTDSSRTYPLKPVTQPFLFGGRSYRVEESDIWGTRLTISPDAGTQDDSDKTTSLYREFEPERHRLRFHWIWVRWPELSSEYKNGAALAKAIGVSAKPLLLKIGAVWCSPCEIMDRTVWTEAEIVALASQRFETFHADLNLHQDFLTSEFGINVVPTYLILASDGERLAVLAKAESGMSGPSLAQFLWRGSLKWEEWERTHKLTGPQQHEQKEDLNF